LRVKAAAELSPQFGGGGQLDEFRQKAPHSTQTMTRLSGSSHQIRSAKRVPRMIASGGGYRRCSK
jgi:hypothetical protein